MKKIILSGGGDENQSFAIDKFFLSSVPKNGKILYIPIALRGHRLFEECELWMLSVLKKHDRSDVVVLTAKEMSPEKLNQDFDAIYIGGGNTWSLLNEIIKSDTLDILKKKINSGIVTYGGSAGAILLGEDISKNPDANDAATDNSKGLDLLLGFSIVPHSDTLEITKNDLYPKTISIPEDGGVFVTEEKIKVIAGNVEFYIPS